MLIIGVGEMSALDASRAVASASVTHRSRGHLSSRACVTRSRSVQRCAVPSSVVSVCEPKSTSLGSRGDDVFPGFRNRGAGRRHVRCHATSKEQQMKDEDLKKYLREKGVDVPSRKTTFSKAMPEDPFEAVDQAIETNGFKSLRLLDLDTVRQRWDVPWGGWRVFLGMSGWTASFVLTAALVLPLLLIVNGVDPRAFDADQQSKYLVEVQLIETIETFLVLWLLLRKFAPEMEGKEFFKMDFADDPFSIEKGWLTWGVIGYVMVFFSIGFTATAIDVGAHAFQALTHSGGAQEVVRGVSNNVGGVSEVSASSSAASSAAVSSSAAASSTAATTSSAASASNDQGSGTIDAVLPLLKSGEGQAQRFFSVLTVTSVLAPLLEEVVFRGFLLGTFLSRKILLAMYCVVCVPLWRFLVRSCEDSSPSLGSGFLIIPIRRTRYVYPQTVAHSKD